MWRRPSASKSLEIRSHHSKGKENVEALGVLRVVLLVGGLFAAAVHDIRSRSVPAWLLASLALLEAILSAIDCGLNGLPSAWQLYVVIDSVLVLALLVLAFACLIGPGDVLAYAAIVFSWPWGWKLLPLPLSTLLYYTLLSLTLVVYNLAANLTDKEARRRLREVPPGKRLYLATTARLVHVRDILAGGWWIPLDIKGSEEIICSADIDPRDIVEREVRAGRLDENERIWAAWGIPAIPFMLVAYIIALLVGDKPILYLLRVIY